MAVAGSRRWYVEVELPSGEMWQHHCWAPSAERALELAQLEFPLAPSLFTDALVEKWVDE